MAEYLKRGATIAAKADNDRKVRDTAEGFSPASSSRRRRSAISPRSSATAGQAILETGVKLAAPATSEVTPDLVQMLETIDARLRWLGSWTIHNDNHLHDSRDGLTVGGHQASSASISTIITALYFAALGPNDRVAVKPHAGPIRHAIPAAAELFL